MNNLKNTISRMFLIACVLLLTFYASVISFMAIAYGMEYVPTFNLTPNYIENNFEEKEFAYKETKCFIEILFIKNEIFLIFIIFFNTTFS